MAKKPPRRPGKEPPPVNEDSEPELHVYDPDRDAGIEDDEQRSVVLPPRQSSDELNAYVPPTPRQYELAALTKFMAKCRTHEDLMEVGQTAARVKNFTLAERELMRPAFVFIRYAIEREKEHPGTIEKYLKILTCRKCGAVALYKDVRIRPKAKRRDCAICGAFIDFSQWDGTDDRRIKPELPVELVPQD